MPEFKKSKIVLKQKINRFEHILESVMPDGFESFINSFSLPAIIVNSNLELVYENKFAKNLKISSNYNSCSEFINKYTISLNLDGKKSDVQFKLKAITNLFNQLSDKLIVGTEIYQSQLVPLNIQENVYYLCYFTKYQSTQIEEGIIPNENMQLLQDIIQNYGSSENDDLQNIIIKSISKIGERLGLDRCLIYQYDAPSKNYTLYACWETERTTAYQKINQHISSLEFSDIHQTISAGDVIHYSDISSLSKNQIDEHIKLFNTAVKSRLLVPLIAKYKFLGFISLDTTNVSIQWHENIIQLLKVITSLFAISFKDKIITDNNKKESIQNKMMSGYPGMIFQINVSNNKLELIYLSEGIEELTGIKAQDVQADSLILKDCIHPDDFDKILAGIEKIKTEKLSWQLDFRIIDSSKNNKWVNCKTFPYIQQDGSIQWYGVIYDITPKKLAEHSVRLHSKIVENMIEGIILIRSNDGIIVYTNSKFDQMFGFSSGELVGHHMSIAFASPEDKSYEDISKIFKNLKKEGSWSGEVQNIKKDGSKLWTSMNASTFDHPEFGEVWFSVSNDITQRVISENKLKHTTEMLENEREELNAKNIALREILQQIELEKQSIRDQIGSNIENIIIPTLMRISNKHDINQIKSDLLILEKDLITISSKFIDNLKKKYSKLSPREIEISNLIKKGMTSKEISQSLNVSLLTIHKHRESIRKKLKIQNKNINLNTYLMKL